MYRIAICDDDNHLCEAVKQILLKQEQRFPDTLDIEIFHSSLDLWEALLAGDEIDLIVLDIHLEQLDGIGLGRRIREILGNETIQLIYLSDDDFRVPELFQVRPMLFLRKPLEEAAMVDAIQKAWCLLSRRSPYYGYTRGTTKYRVRIQDILYMSSQGKKLLLHMVSEVRDFYGKLSVEEEKLKAHFICIHKSYLVNMAHIQEIRSHEVLLNNGERLPISKARKESVRQLAEKYQISL